ncbi:MAG: hypothetical protein IJB70_11570 [Clostridia bacterium]|nr:hypothetical protein [Clostridia bacterium]
MKELAMIIEKEIKKQFKSVRQFSVVSGIPQTTIVSALKNGIGGMAYESVVKICELLHIELVNYNTHLVMTNDVINMVNMFNSLDEKGEHAVMAFMSMEFNRCNSSLDYIAKATEQSNELARRKINDQKSQNPFEMINVISNQQKPEDF